MKNTYLLFACLIIAVAFTACSNNETSTKTTTETTDSTKNANDEGVDVSLKGNTSISIGGNEASVKTRSGTSVQVNEKGVKVNSKNTKVDVRTKH